MPSTFRSAAGITHAATEGERMPRLPHEHDESSDSGSGPQQQVIRQASADIEQGLVDTDRGSVTDALYRDSLKKPVPKVGDAEER